MRVLFDRGRCSGHARCWALAPDVFTLDGEGFCNVETSIEVSAGQEAAVVRAVQSCPERALTIAADD